MLGYKPFRSIEIQRSEVIVSKIITVLEEEYLNPFSGRLDEDKLYNLSSSKQREGETDASKVIDTNREIIGKLLKVSAKTQQPINFEQALKYPLYDVPLSMANPDGTKRESPNSKLLQLLAPQLSPIEQLPDDLRKQHATIIIDLIAHISECNTTVMHI